MFYLILDSYLVFLPSPHIRGLHAVYQELFLSSSHRCYILRNIVCLHIRILNILPEVRSTRERNTACLTFLVLWIPRHTIPDELKLHKYFLRALVTNTRSISELGRCTAKCESMNYLAHFDLIYRYSASLVPQSLSIWVLVFGDDRIQLLTRGHYLKSI